MPLRKEKQYPKRVYKGRALENPQLYQPLLAERRCKNATTAIKRKIETTVSKTHGKTFKIYHPYRLSGDLKTRQQQEKAKIDTTVSIRLILMLNF